MRRWLKRCGFLPITLLISNVVCGQSGPGLKAPQPVYRNFSVTRGLPSSETYYVHQDKKGFIWICTDRGVARYDGYRFHTFTKRDGLTDDVVFRIYEDYKGRLWFITYNGLLCYWENDRIHPYKYNNRIREYLKNDVTTFKSFSIDRNDNVLFSASLLGPVSISADGKLKKQYEGKKPVTYLYRNGNDWFVSPVNSYGKVAPCLKIEGTKRTIFPGVLASVAVYTASNAERSFLQVNSTVFDIDSPGTHDSIPLLSAINCDEEYLWQCTGKGVVRTPLAAFGKSREQDRLFLDGYFVTWAMRDSEGGMWFSTLENGVFYTPDPDVLHYRKTAAGYSAVYDVNGVGTNVVYANKLGYHQLYAPFRTYVENAIDNKNVIFLGSTLFIARNANPERANAIRSDENTFFISPANNAFETVDHKLLVVRTSVGRYSASGEYELLYFCFDKKKNSHEQHFLHAVSQDADGRIYVGNANGLFEVSDLLLSIDHFNDKRFKARVTDLDYHPAWKNIVATRGIGIYFFDRYRIMAHLTEKDGLLDNQINSLFVDKKGVIWISTDKGVNRISRQNGKIVVERITVHHGLPSNEVNAVYAYDGKVWVATRKGLAVLSDHRRTSKKAQLEMLQIETDHETIKPTGKWFVIAPGREYIKILLRSSNFRTGIHRLVRYRFDRSSKWLTVRSGEILIPKPAPGDYELEVSSMDENGNWSEPRVLARFQVAPAFYRTWYFIGALILLGMGGMYLLFRLRLRQINRRNQLQKTINSLEQKALRAQMNPHFIFNSLNSIQSFLLYEENEKAEKYLLRFAHLIRQTLNNSRESCIPIESEIETLRGYLALEQMRFKEKFTFEIVCLLSPEELQYGVPPMLIQPFVENAVLHGFKTMETGGRIEVRFEKLENQRLLCIVEDNGIGRKATMSAKPEGHKSFGTKITEERLAAFRQKYGDEFSIETIDKEQDGSPAGTKVVMHIPVVNPEEIASQEEQ